LVYSIAEKGSGAIWIKIEVKNKERAERIIRILSPIKDYIKESKEEGIAG
jgi:hypothetical protein